MTRVLTETVIDYQTGQSRQVIRIDRNPAPIQKITTKHTTTTAKPAKPESVDECESIVRYHAEQLAQLHGPADTRDYRTRVKDRMLAAATSPKPVSENAPALPKSLIGRTWKVGDMTATIVSDDGSMCQYRFGQFGPLHSIDRDKAERNCKRRSLPTTNVEACSSGRKMTSKEPTNRTATSSDWTRR